MPEPGLLPLWATQTTTRSNRTGSWRAFRPVYVQQTSPCREACPAGEEIARWIDLLRGRAYRQAWELLTEENPFPATLGRICVHPCQSACNRGKHDEAIGINSLEQFLGDRALAEGWSFAPPAVERPERVAVVGGGPAGLSAIYHLRRMGYQVTLFEASDRLGGQLTAAVPDYHLPRRVVEAEIDRTLRLGVDVEFGLRVGEELTWAELRSRFDAVFGAVGAPVLRQPQLGGAELEGVVSGLALLQQVKAGQRPAVGRSAVVIGAGLTGIEAARTLLRLGAEVTLVTAESEADLALPGRVQEALAEGAALAAGADVRELVGSGGAAAGVRLADRLLPADMVVLATGREVQLESLPEEAGVDSAFHVVADPFTGATEMARVYAGGDMTGTRYAVEAVGAGKRAAAAIHAALQGRDACESMEPARLGHSPNLSMRSYLRPESYPAHLSVRNGRVVDYADIEPLYFPPKSRTHRSWTQPAERVRSFQEARAGLTEAQALAESQRCFSCGTCIGCDNCLIFCPDMAISRRPDGTGFTVNWDYCKGCGACVNECPREALVLEEEVKS